jgi:DnaJ-like protein
MRDPTVGLEKIITDAQKEGKFEDLRGKGQRLVIDPSPDAVVKSILKEANVSVAPEWIVLAGEIDRLLEQEQQLLQTYATAAAADQAALLGSHRAPPVPPTSPGQPLTKELRRRGWRALAAPLAWKRPVPPGQRLPDEATVGAHQRRWDLTLEQYAALLHQINRQIRRFNQIVPLAHRQRALLPVRERLEAFTERFPRLARAEEGAVRRERGHVPAALLAAPAEPQEKLRPKRDVLQAVALLRTTPRGRKPPPPIG